MSLFINQFKETKEITRSGLDGLLPKLYLFEQPLKAF